MKLTKLLSVLPLYKTLGTLKEQSIQKIEIDHRRIEQGDVFICIKGFTVDGHQFAQKAVDRGAKVIISEKNLQFSEVPTIVVDDTVRALALLANNYYHYPSAHLYMIGITGTNGKTTLTYLLEDIFNKYNAKTGIIGTIQMKIGNKTMGLKNTTPDALHLQKYLAEMTKEKVDIAMMEVSSHALDLNRTNGIDFDMAVYTNLSQDHLDFHKNMEQYLLAKSKLFTSLGNTYTSESKYAIINVDDVYSDKIIERTIQPIITYGIKKNAHFMAKDIQLSIRHTLFNLVTPYETIEIKSNLIGLFNVYNMLAAIAVAYMKGVPLVVIKKSLEEITGVDGRFEKIDLGQPYGVIVDYAHTPDSLENVLQTIRKFSKGNIIVVVGSGGDRDRGKRPIMGNIAMKYSDWTIFTSDNPRTEDPQVILKDMTTNLTDKHFEIIEDRQQAIEQAVNLANKEDVILIAGKGHETYQEIKGIRYDFDDRHIAKEAIKAREKRELDEGINE